jgi:hypothetical protein
LLCCFDKSGDEGNFGVGLVDGPLYDVNEIDEVLKRARLAWVQSVRAAGKPKAPRWIMKEPGLRDYFDALGDPDGFDLRGYENDEDAADELRANTDNEIWHAREDFLSEVLSKLRLGSSNDREGFRRSDALHHLFELVGTHTKRDRRRVYGETQKHTVSREIIAHAGAVRDVVGIRRGAISGNMKVSFQAARSIG